jgi:hypothetical protein
MIVGYKRYLSFLLDSLQRDYLNLSYVVDDLVFDFNQYVLSQMHLGILCHYYGRSLASIYNVLNAVEYGGDINFDELQKVLLWYYYDLSLFVRGISSQGCLTNINISLRVSLDLGRVKISFEDEKAKVLSCIDTGVRSEYSKYLGLTFNEVSKFRELFLSDVNLDRFIASIILRRYSESFPGKVLEMGGAVECH